MMRTPGDVLRSFYPFFAAHRDEFRAIWGGFPPVYSDHEALINDFDEQGPLGPMLWGYANVWWRYRHEPNVLLMHYNDVIADLEGTVRVVAEFVNVQVWNIHVKCETQGLVGLASQLPVTRIALVLIGIVTFLNPLLVVVVAVASAD